jgi:hypothetical protein
MSGRAPELRASDADRDRVAVALREHCAQGRLTLEELAGRLDRTYSARTLGELEALTTDLPVAATAAAPRRPKRKARRFVISIFGGSDRRGRWRVPRRVLALTLFGGVDLDFREAQIEDEVVTITMITIFGGDDVYIPEGIEVDVGGIALFGGNGVHGRDLTPRPGTPMIRIRVFTLFGGSDVWLVPPDAHERSLREIRRAVGAGRSR